MLETFEHHNKLPYLRVRPKRILRILFFHIEEKQDFTIAAHGRRETKAFSLDCRYVVADPLVFALPNRSTFAYPVASCRQPEQRTHVGKQRPVERDNVRQLFVPNRNIEDPPRKGRLRERGALA